MYHATCTLDQEGKGWHSLARLAYVGLAEVLGSAVMGGSLALGELALTCQAYYRTGRSNLNPYLWSNGFPIRNASLSRAVL